MTARSGATTVAVAAAGIAACAPAVYLAALSLAATRSAAAPAEAAAPAGPAERLRLAVVVPAHDESALIARSIQSLQEQDYPADLVRLVVVADNCTDDTAAKARLAGAEVMVRDDPTARGKGHALRWAMSRLVETDPALEAIVVVDADSVVDPQLLDGLVSAAAEGADVVQADYGALVEGEDHRSQLRAAAFLLFHQVRFTGKARLGLPCSLVGNGMLFRRRVVVEHPWSAFSEVEDLEYSLQLRMAGVEPRFAPKARLVAPVASAGVAAEIQRSRWEGGRAKATRTYLPRLLREAVAQRRIDRWDAAADLAVPPLGVLAAAIVAGGAGTTGLAAAGAVHPVAILPWAVAGVALPGHVLVGLRAAEAPPQMTQALIAAPRLVATEMGTRIGVMKGQAQNGWVRTPRGSETAPRTVPGSPLAPVA